MRMNNVYAGDWTTELAIIASSEPNDILEENELFFCLGRLAFELNFQRKLDEYFVDHHCIIHFISFLNEEMSHIFLEILFKTTSFTFF